MRTTLFLAAVIALSACGASRTGSFAGPPFPADLHYARPSSHPRDNDVELRDVEAGKAFIAKDLAASDLVFVGTVIHVAPSPGVWSGAAVVRQPVLYRVDKVLKGRAPDDEVVVHHMIVGPPTTDADTPRLSTAIWREGARLVLAASVAPAPGADLTPGGHGLLCLNGTIDPVAADGPAGAIVIGLVR